MGGTGGTVAVGGAGGAAGGVETGGMRGDEVNPPDDGGPPQEAAPPDTGPRVLFSFDTNGDFTACDRASITPPCWITTRADDAGGPGGTFASVADDAVTGHTPARALAWTAPYPQYGAPLSILGNLPVNQNWTGRTRLHFPVRVTSGSSSVDSFDVFIQGGVEANYVSIYQAHIGADLLADSGAGSVFVDLTIDFTDPDVPKATLGSVAGVGILLRSITEGSGSAPPPTVVEIDNIWLE
jgi:hypothetical protein